MTFAEVWNVFLSLRGKRLHTLDQHRLFLLEAVQHGSLTVRPEQTGYSRTIPRSHFEEAWQRLQEGGRLPRTEIQREISPFNPAYIATLLAQVPGVQHRLSPIVLSVTPTATQAEPPVKPREFLRATPEDDQAPEHETEPSVKHQELLGDVLEDDQEPANEEMEEALADRLVEHGRSLGFEAKKEWRTDLGNRIDVVWARPVPRGLPGFSEGALLPVIGFEIETSWRTRKHIKGDIFNLQDLAPALGVIVLCKGPADSAGEIASLQAAARRYVDKLGLRIHIWTDSDAAQFVARPHGRQAQTE